MACELKPKSSQNKCGSSTGGTYVTYLAKCEDVTDVIFDADGNITNYVMASVGAWAKYEGDDDKSSFFNQTTTRTNKKTETTQSANLKFAGIGSADIHDANHAMECCCVYGIHFLNGGVVLSQGIHYNYDTGEWRPTNEKLKITVDANSLTAADEENMLYKLESVGQQIGVPVLLTQAAIEAL